MARSSATSTRHNSSVRPWRRIVLSVFTFFITSSMLLLGPCGGAIAGEPATAQVATVAPRCDYVAKVWIVAVGPGGTGGHAFLIVRNIGRTKRHFHGFTLRSGRALTIGTWGNKEDGKGIYFNLEGYFFHHDGAYQDNVALAKNLCLGDFQWLRDVMPNYNEWSYSSNCSTFVMRMWNQIAPRRKVDADDGSFGGLDSPTRLANSIRQYDELKDIANLPRPAESQVGRFHGTGDIDPVSSSSLGGSSSSS